MSSQKILEDRKPRHLEYPQEIPLGKKIMRSVAFGALRYVLLAPIPFLMTPFILHKVGVAGYGTWAVFLAVNGMTSLTDLGLVGTLSKFVAEYHAQRDFVALSRLLSSALAIFLGLGFAAAIVVGGISPLLVRALFHGTSIPQAELIFLLRCFVIVIVANILILLLSSITSGLQRLDLTYVINAGNIVSSAGLAALLLLRGWGLRGLVYAYAAAAVVTVLAYAVVVRQLLPRVSVNPLRFDALEARRMFGFSLRLYVIQASVGIQNQIDKFFLALLMGVAAVGWFEIASDVGVKLRALIGLILAPVLPAAAELNALGDRTRTQELYYRTHKYLAFFGIPVVVCAGAFSTRFVELWLGPTLGMIAIPMTILVAAGFINLTSGPGFLIFAGRGHLRPAIQSCVLGVALNICLSLALIYKFGFAGAAIGTAVSISISSIFLTWKFHNESGYPFSRLLSESYLKPIVCSGLVMGVLLAVRPLGNLRWTGLIAMGIGFGIVYSIVILLSQFFDDYDWGKIESLVPAVRHARRVGWIG